MSTAESLLPEFDHEMAGTRRVIQNVSDEILDWKAHEKSNTIGWVASHLADIPVWTNVCINQDSFDIDPPDGPPDRMAVLDSVAKIIESFDANVAGARDVLAAAPDEQFMKPWAMLKRGEVQMTMPRIGVFRSFILNHSIHHRAHLCVYLRLNDLPVPALYGPSADDDSI